MREDISCLRLMSHELRTPLNAIIGFSDIMARGLAGPVSSEQERQLTMIGGAGRQLLSLINDMMDVAKAQSGQVFAAVSPVDPFVLLSECADGMESLAMQRGVQLLIQEAPDPPKMIMTDPALALRVLGIIVESALKHSQDCDITLSIGEPVDSRFEFRVEGLALCAQGGEWARLFGNPMDEPMTPLPTDEVTLELCVASEFARALGGEIVPSLDSEGILDAVVLVLPTKTPQS